ncbi:Ni/Fe-hydrogenase, b-type cytochrome subunit [Parageobacillus genomosp. 1]|uniref:Ni/Fe-hydrogenase, b-type cytochrome subunit n=1 Tax=Parageobacillus genomosp. 1 TaxID=1295642 RepID=A0ABC9VFY0_9BACL|nr:Ni/Fe-hydrogenase, b-type cytochrome subunit [Parageobacillus genomosp. 1]EZP77462.1 Ni/Fe-hydrogenase, b-type cytochrome subunit [Parageobacillus genomosp. 1]
MSIPTNPKIEKETVKIVWKKSRKRKVKTIPLNDQMVKVYVWELPVRIFHWINAFSIFILMITGVFIGRPFASASIPEEAYYSYLMGWARYVHFFTAFVFTINLAVRWYWVYKGNEHATSNLLRLSFWKETWETVKYYLFLKNKKKHYIGHNPLAQLSYWIFIGLGSIIMILTGYYLLFEPQPESIYGKMFMWVAHLFGGDSFSVRSWHHLVAWGFMIFTIVHVYMAFREDYLQRNGTMSSIVTGYKMERKKETLGEQDEK